MSQAPYDPPRRLYSTSTDDNHYDVDPANYIPPHPSSHSHPHPNPSLTHSYDDNMTDFQQPYRDQPGGLGVGVHQRNVSAASAGTATRLGGVGATDKDEFDPFQPPPKATGDLRMWRRDHHGNMWLKGGRGRCVGRFCCCAIMTVILLFVSIVLTLLLFLRPPDIEFSGIQPLADKSAVVAAADNLTVNLGIGISVRNPNYFSVTFKSIKASISYPPQDTQIGGGERDNVLFKSNSKTTFTFPFQFQYSVQADPDQTIIKDILNKCGFIPGSQKEQLTLKYKLQLAVQILFVTINPPIEGSASFDCPFTLDQVQPLIDSIPGLKGAIGGLLS